MQNSYRYLLIIVLINMLIGLASATYSVATNSPDYSTTTYEYQTLENELSSNDTLLGNQQASTQLQYENTVFNSLKVSRFFVTIIVSGINPLSVRPGQFDTVLEQLIANLLILFRSLMYVISVLLIWQLVKSNKTS